MNKFKTLLSVSAAIALISIAGPASASLLGDTVTAEYDAPTLGIPQCGVYTPTVASDSSDTVNVLLGCFGRNILFFDVDMNGYGFTGTIGAPLGATFNANGFDGLSLSGLDWGFIPAGYQIETSLPGWDDARATFAASSMNFNFAGLPAAGVGQYYFNVQAVPEPGTLALLGFGLAGLGFARRRRLK